MPPIAEEDKVWRRNRVSCSLLASQITVIGSEGDPEVNKLVDEICQLNLIQVIQLSKILGVCASIDPCTELT
jgi:hypothetical protein